MKTQRIMSIVLLLIVGLLASVPNVNAIGHMDGSNWTGIDKIMDSFGMSYLKNNTGMSNPATADLNMNTKSITNATINWNLNNINLQNSTVNDTGLVFDMRFNENSTGTATSTKIYDSSKFSNDGTWYGSAIPNWTAGKYGGGLLFDGVDDYVSFSSISSTTRTQEGWFYFSQLASSKGNFNHLFDNLYQNNANNLIYLRGTSDYFNFIFTINTWYHIVFTFTNSSNNADAKLYINGVPYSLTQQATPHTVNLVSMISHNSGSWGFKGTIDNVRIYNRALSAAEIRTAYYSNPLSDKSSFVQTDNFRVVNNSGYTNFNVDKNGIIIGTYNVNADLDMKNYNITNTYNQITRNLIVNGTPWVDVRAFGAKGDGINDDTVAIQAAINSGKLIIIPQGTYKVSQSIILSQCTTILGSTAGATVIKSSFIDATPVFKLEQGLNKDVKRVTIRDIWISGDGVSSSAIDLRTNFSSNHYIENVEIRDFSNGVGINAMGVVSSRFINVVIKNSSVGLKLGRTSTPEITGSNANTFIGCNFREGVIGVDIIGTEATANTFLNCLFESNTDIGMRITNTSSRNIVILGSHFESNTNYDIYINGGTVWSDIMAVTIDSNWFAEGVKAKHTSIFLDFSSNIKITNNIFTSDTVHNIVINSTNARRVQLVENYGSGTVLDNGYRTTKLLDGDSTVNYMTAHSFIASATSTGFKSYGNYTISTPNKGIVFSDDSFQNRSFTTGIFGTGVTNNNNGSITISSILSQCPTSLVNGSMCLNHTTGAQNNYFDGSWRHTNGTVVT